MRGYFAAGGKRIRPHLARLAHAACDGSPDDDILAVATSWELLHGCMLMHDDIIDRDDKRHGQPNISGVYRRTYRQSADAQHFADSTALIAGDLALSAAHHIVMASRLDNTVKQLIQQQLEAATFAVAGGELLDVQATLDDPKTADTTTIAHYKTAEYSFCGPLVSGALLAGGNEEALASLRDFGTAVGTAYQLVDDVLGVTGDETATGKPSDSDIREGKRTEVLRQTYLHVDAADRRMLDTTLAKGHAMTDKDVALVKKCIQQSGSLKIVQAEIDSYERRAHDAIAAMPFKSEYLQAFANLANMILHREA